MIAQLFKFKAVVSFADACSYSGDDIADLLAGDDLYQLGFLYVQDLSAQRKDCLENAVAALLGRTAGRVSFHYEDLRFLGVALLAVGQFAGQAGLGERAFAAGQVFGAAGGLAGLGGAQAFLADSLGNGGMLLEEDGEGFSGKGFNYAFNLAVAQLGLGLAFELGVGDLDGNNNGEAFAHIVAGYAVFLVFQEVVLFNVVVYNAGQRGPEAGDVGSALYGLDIIDEGEDGLGIVRVVLYGEVEHNFALRLGDEDGLFV